MNIDEDAKKTPSKIVFKEITKVVSFILLIVFLPEISLCLVRNFGVLQNVKLGARNFL